jgi:glutamine amidotransferase
MLEGLRSGFRECPKRPKDLWQAVADVSRAIGARGSFNFLLGDGRHLYARCATKLCYLVRRAPFGHASLSDEDVSVDFSEVTTPDDRVAVVSTVPLTKDEAWVPGEPGHLWVFDQGALRATLPA